ncbi:MAG: hypothetical protein HY859_11120 [Caulobacterales bacterium]|nr:hypothetical protein [Caulobacterales bacterium]
MSTIVTLSLLSTACTTDAAIGSDQPRLAFACGDIVVEGKLKNLGAGKTERIEGDVLGHGWFSAEIRIRRHLAGPMVGPRLQVRYFGHTWMREDRDFVFVVALSGDGKGYIINRAALASTHPRLKDECS